MVKTQQEFLREALSKLGMTRAQLAERISPPGESKKTKRRIDNWLLPSDSKEFRKIDEVAFRFIQDILSQQSA